MSAGNGAAEFAGGTSDPKAETNSDTGMVSWRDPRLVAAMLLLVPGVIVAVWQARQLGWPADLLAVWVAGEFWQMGRVDEVYPAASGLFTMMPPSGWVDWLAETQG